MNTKINYKASIPYFICITTYMFAAIVNIQVVEQVLVFKEIPAGLLDQVYHYDILGYLIGSLMLLFFSNYFHLQKIIIFNLLIYALSVYNVGFSTFSELFQKIYPMIYSLTNSVIITSLLYYIFSDKRITHKYSIAFFLFSIFIAYFLAQIVLYYIFLGTDSPDLVLIRILVIVNIIPITIFLCSFLLSSCFHQLKTKPVNSLIVLKNIDLELLASFSIFYITMTVFYGYETYKFTDNLLMISVSSIRYYIFAGILLLAVFLSKFIFNYNLHKINIACITTLLLMFSSISFWSNDILLSSISWFLITIFLYLYFCSNLLIIAAKFTDFYLQLAIILYTLAGAVGYFCSYIAAENADVNDDRYNFLIPICLILGTTLLYYLYRYQRNQLEKW
jgi:MFS family permease